MSVVRVEKTKNYTTMSNYHFKEKKMSLKAKGLLSLMLSLPDDWDYTITGLVSICKENETAIKSTLKELKQFGYLVITKNKPTEENGGRISYDYIIYEKPIQEDEKQELENLYVENQVIENQRQLNTKELNINNKNINNKNIINKEKPKKSKKHQNYIEIYNMLEEFTTNENIKSALKKYLKVRTTERSLNIEQWNIILTNLRNECGTNSKYALQLIEQATACGWMQIVYQNKFNGKLKSSYSCKPGYVDNTEGHVQLYHISDEDFDKLTHEEKIQTIYKIGALADMTEKQREFHDLYCVVRDKNGNPVKF